MVQSLQEKIKAEQESRMRRALEDLERSARMESERARQMFEAQQNAETVVSNKFKHLVGDLRRSWEEEEASRAKQLEERLRNHYSAVLEHMESQLQMALRLQDEADKQWMEDVEARNKQQVTTMKAFEEKCRRLYDTRLSEYIEKTDQQLTDYEEQLLQVGANLATERARFESRLRRLKLSCGRWKADYQREIQGRYREMAAVLEARYMSEIEQLLTELVSARSGLTDTENSVQLKERDLFEERRRAELAEKRAGEGDRDKRAGRQQLAVMRESLLKLWQGIGTSPEEKVQVLVALLDCADPSPELTRKYEAIQAKLSARLPIMQLATKKQLIEHKLQYLQAPSASPNPQDRAEVVSSKNILLKDLAETTRSIEISVREYEQTYGERFVVNNTTLTVPQSAPAGGHPAPGARHGSPSRQGDNGSSLVSNVASVLSNPVQRPMGRGGMMQPQSRPGRQSFH